MPIRSVVFDDFVCDKTLMGIDRFEVCKSPLFWDKSGVVSGIVIANENY